MEWYYVGLSICFLGITLVAIFLFKKQMKLADALKAGDTITYNGRKGVITSVSGHEATVLLKVPKMALSKE